LRSTVRWPAIGFHYGELGITAYIAQELHLG
jgi:hypothetical protein